MSPTVGDPEAKAETIGRFFNVAAIAVQLSDCAVGSRSVNCLLLEPRNPRVGQALVLALKGDGDGDDVAVAVEPIRQVDIDTLKIPGTNPRKNVRAHHEPEYG